MPSSTKLSGVAPSLTLYPNGRVGVKWTARRFKPEPIGEHHLTPDQDFEVRQVRLHGIEETISAKRGARPLGLSNVAKFSQAKLPARRGLKGLTGRGRSLIQNGCLLLERMVDRKQIAFFTCTLPPHIPEPTAEEWSAVNDLFLRSLRKRLVKEGLPEHIVGCTEIQGKRYEQTGRPCKHIHGVFVGRERYGHWRILPNELTEMWRSAVCNVIGNGNDNGNWNASCNVQRIRKSVSGYMAKYMSKGTDTIQRMVEEGHTNLIPSTWYFCTNELRRMVDRATKKLVGEVALQFLDSLKSCIEKTLWFWRDVRVKGADGRDFVVGSFGQLTPIGMEIAQHFVTV